MHHFTSPRWFNRAGGFTGDEGVDRFVSYVETLAPILHDVHRIVTINEPNILAVLTATMAAFDAPGTGEPATTAMASMPEPSLEFAARIGEVHKAAVAVVREATDAKVGWAVAAQAFTTTARHEDVFDRVLHAWEGAYYEQSAGDDLIGVQAYTSQSVDEDGPVPHPPHPDNTLTGWAYRPDALGINVRRVWDKYRTPIFVTENGIATDDDNRRIAYTTGALQGLEAAIEDGAEVLGYTHWSLLDNYEWGSYKPTFGLISVDRNNNFQRTPKPSLTWLGRVAASNGQSLQP